MTYQYSKTLRVPFEEVIMKVKDTLHQQGFTMISAMDVRDHMARNLGVNFRNYKILTACNPELSYKAISLEPHIGVLLPCSIVVQEHENGQTEVSAVSTMQFIDQNMVTPSLEILAAEINLRLRTAIDGVHHKKSAFSFAYN